ncbi:MAG: hypothetical protein C0624_00250 [Desulfuromonas sp.]|nr:MAG: hypothetical protein C0624_00250 [Desulfuromonas sp.]
MLKQLKIYYLFVSFPFIMLIIGATAFWGAIAGTLDRNPHPQINYTIFVIIIVGGLLIIYNAILLMREAKVLKRFTAALHAKTDAATLKEMANSFDCEIACLVQMMANSTDRSISHQEQAALEHEVTNVHGRITKRNSLPSYLTGLLVGMGLLGTFIGLLATLGDIGALIGSFSDLDMSAADPIVVFSNMIEKMKAPMNSMAIAFSASMFGLLGSIILGLMMVGMRRFQGDIDAVLNSEVARHVEMALSFESITFRGDSASIGCYEQPSELTSKVLLRIEERLTEAARIRQRALSTEIDDFKKQRGDMLQALTEQTEANNTFSSVLQQLGKQMSTVFNAMEQRNSEISNQLSELAVSLAGDAKQTQKLLAGQLDEQRRLIDTLGSYNIDERLSESSKVQQRMLNAVAEDMKNQREEVLQTLSQQNETGKNLHSELQQMGSQLETISDSIDKGNGEVSSQLSELTVLLGADAKEAHRLMSLGSNNVRAELQQLGGRIAENLEKFQGVLGEGTDALGSGFSDLQTQIDGAHDKTLQLLRNLEGGLEKGFEQVGTGVASLQEGLGRESNESRQQIVGLQKDVTTEMKQLATQLTDILGGINKGSAELKDQLAALIPSPSPETGE